MAAQPLPWDYSALAAHYEHRAPYHPDTVARIRALALLPAGARVADIGAGTGRAARMLAAAGFLVDAVEPNDAMRAIGMALTRHSDLRWHASRGEATALADGEFDLVNFASSFNVVEPNAALAEAARLLHPQGALACFWNHRELDDPLQRDVEAAIRRHVPDYQAGARREDPSLQIAAHGAFVVPESAVLRFVHRTRAADFVDGFRAHATLARQAGDAMPRVVADIARCVEGLDVIDVPFVTRLWVARRRPVWR